MTPLPSPSVLSFAAALVAFALLRGPEPAAPFVARRRRGARPPATPTPRSRGCRTPPARPRAPSPRASRSPPRTCRRRARPATPAYYGRADELLRAALARRPGDPRRARRERQRWPCRGTTSALPGAGAARAGGAAGRARRLSGARRRARRARPLRRRRAAAAAPGRREAGRSPAYARVSYLRELHGDLGGAVAAMRRAAAAGGPARESAASVHALLGGLELAARPVRRRARRLPGGARRRAARTPPPRPGSLGSSAATGDLDGAIRRWRALVGAAAAARVRDRAGRGGARPRRARGPRWRRAALRRAWR